MIAKDQDLTAITGLVVADRRAAERFDPEDNPGARVADGDVAVLGDQRHIAGVAASRARRGVQDRRTAIGESAVRKPDAAFAARRDIDVTSVAGSLIESDGIGVAGGPTRRVNADDRRIRNQ